MKCEQRIQEIERSLIHLEGGRAMGLWEAMYRVVTRRNSVYVTFVVAGALAGERVVDYGVHKLWESNNVGKRYEDISVRGQSPTECLSFED